MQVWLSKALADLAPFASRERAAQEKAYLKSQLTFLGVGIPKTRQVAISVLQQIENHGKLTATQLRDLTLAAWATEGHDARAIALALLEKRAKCLGIVDLPWLEDVLRRSFTWAYVDQIAVHAVGQIVRKEPDAAKRVLAKWASDKDFWLRRSALLALLGERRAGGRFDGAHFEAWALPMLAEKEFFIRKAIGWVLRDVARDDAAWVQGFLERHAAQMSPLSLREARRGVARALDVSK